MVVLNLSVLTSVRRIVKIAVRFLHTKTALCDRKDTQSRFAVNAARSIVCVETSYPRKFNVGRGRFQCRTQHCVCRDKNERYYGRDIVVFQCRTQHCVCRDMIDVWTENDTLVGFNAARSIVCVETIMRYFKVPVVMSFQCRTQHCVCRDHAERIQRRRAC